MIRPSSLPMLAACPCFDSAPDRGEDDKDAGTLRHHAMAHALAGDTTELTALDSEDADKVQWALDYIGVHSPDGHQMRIEQQVSLITDDFETITGTPDVTCGNQLFDLKWRYRNYKEQMAAYSLAMIQADNWPSVRYHILFADGKHVETGELTLDEAENITSKVIAAAKDPLAKPVACDYCTWCSRRLTCPALTSDALTIVQAREDISAEHKAAFEIWLAAGAHTSQLTDAHVAGMVLTIARKLSDFSEAAEKFCKDLALKQGIVPTGFKLQSRQGNRFISSVTDAFARAGLPQDEFLKICEIKLTALVEKYADVNGMKKAQAERTVEEKLGEIIQRKQSTMSLVADKQK